MYTTIFFVINISKDRIFQKILDCPKRLFSHMDRNRC
jgi:hypothetical protein